LTELFGGGVCSVLALYRWSLEECYKSDRRQQQDGHGERNEEAVHLRRLLARQSQE